MIMKLTGTTFSQFYPKTLGQFDCNPKYLFKISLGGMGYDARCRPDRHQVPRAEHHQAAELSISAKGLFAH